jgi:hypothetical protein
LIEDKAKEVMPLFIFTLIVEHVVMWTPNRWIRCGEYQTWRRSTIQFTFVIEYDPTMKRLALSHLPNLKMYSSPTLTITKAMHMFRRYFRYHCSKCNISCLALLAPLLSVSEDYAYSSSR